MDGESLVDQCQVTPQEILEVYIRENSQMKLELESYKLLTIKLVEALREAERDLRNNSDE